MREKGKKSCDNNIRAQSSTHHLDMQLMQYVHRWRSCSLTLHVLQTYLHFSFGALLVSLLKS